MAAASTRATAALAPYNVTLSSSSPLFLYAPSRDTDVTQGWNASYTGAEGPGAKGVPPTDGVSFRRTQAEGSRVSFNFEGTGLYLCFDSGSASFALTLDGKIVDTTVSAANERVCAQAKGEADTLLYASGLSYGSHSALLQVAASAEREFRFFGGALEIGVQTGGKVVDDSRTIDDQDSGWALSPGRGGGQWDTATGDRLFNVTTTFDCNYGNTQLAAYKFSGAGGAVLLGGIGTESHAFSVQLDDQDPLNLDASSGWQDGSAAFFIVGALDPAQEHTITVRNFNSDVPDCNVGRFCCLQIDALQLLRSGKDDLPSGSSQDPGNGGQQGPGPDGGSSSKKSNTAVIAGGVVAGVLGVLLIALLAFFLLHRRRRRKRKDQPSIDGHPPMTDAHLARPWAAPESQVLSHSQVGSSDVSSPAVGGMGPDGHWSPYTTTSNTTSGPGPVVATGDRKQRSGPGLMYQTVNQSQSHANLNAPYAPSAAGGSTDSALSPDALSPGARRLAQEDLEQVLAFVAQRMDGGRAPVASVHEPEDLPRYRG